MLGEALDISRETYLAILMDREFQGPVIVASPEGGVDIEEVAEKTPDKIYKVRFFYFQQRLQIQLYNSD
jgi:succinyl-CoA synthetase beta subunit